MSAFEKGMLAKLHGKQVNNNPYPKELRLHSQWLRGFLFVCQS